MDAAAHARDLLDRNRYLVLGTADADGSPWVTPVWFVPDGLTRVLWISRPGSRHSQLLGARPQVALTVLDTSLPSDQAAAFYATGEAGLVPDDALDDAVALAARRSAQHDLDPFGRDRLSGDAPLRLYSARILRAWVLDQDATTDRRAEVPLG